MAKDFSNIAQEITEKQRTKKKKEISLNNDEIFDQEIISRVYSNLKKLSSSSESKHILESLKSDISLCPISISKFIKNPFYSLSGCFQNTFNQPENSKLLLEVINQIINLDDDYAYYFSTDVYDIFQLIENQDSSAISTQIVVKIMRNSEDGADNLIFDGLFETIFQSLQNNNGYLIDNFVKIIRVSIETCHNEMLIKNKGILISLLHTIFFNYNPTFHSQIVICFIILLDYADCRPSIVLTKTVFEHILQEFSQNPLREYLFLFNSILQCDNKDQEDENRNTFFLDYLNIFDLLIDNIQDPDKTRLIFRLFANFSYVESYCQFIISENIYATIFDYILNNDLPFKWRDDPCIFFCRVFSLSPNDIASYPEFDQLFYMTVDIIESFHSKILTESFFIMFDELDNYLQITQLELDINIEDILNDFANSNYPEIAQWASSKLS